MPAVSGLGARQDARPASGRRGPAMRPRRKLLPQSRAIAAAAYWRRKRECAPRDALKPPRWGMQRPLEHTVEQRRAAGARCAHALRERPKRTFTTTAPCRAAGGSNVSPPASGYHRQCGEPAPTPHNKCMSYPTWRAPRWAGRRPLRRPGPRSRRWCTARHRSLVPPADRRVCPARQSCRPAARG